ncbi:MAG: hypothetical protein CM1200mP2_40920 [Planctomycetaceae bacterium]|nr:MAG: hypothetical protein CM1200mP2_40920 [Planctomycetaceae bacterium]
MGLGATSSERAGRGGAAVTARSHQQSEQDGRQNAHELVLWWIRSGVDGPLGTRRGLHYIGVRTEHSTVGLEWSDRGWLGNRLSGVGLCGRLSVMINVGQFRSRTCGGPSRRSFLKMGASLPLVMGRPDLSSGAQADRGPLGQDGTAGLAVGGPRHTWTPSTPSRMPPANTAARFRRSPPGPPGVRFTDLLPRMASISDRFALARTHVSSQPGHPDAGTVALTGFHEKPGPVQPNFGAIVARHRGRTADLPPFLSVGRGVIQDSVRDCRGLRRGDLRQGVGSVPGGRQERRIS